MTTLIIVDVQFAFEIPQKLVERIDQYSRRFDLRVFTRFVNPPGSVFRRVLKQRSCAPGSEEIQLRIPAGKKDIVIDKAGYGLSASAIRRLKKAGVKRATVCGIETDACVLGVMFSLFDAGITCRVKPDLCWSSTGLHKAGLRVIEMQFPQRHWQFHRK